MLLRKLWYLRKVMKQQWMRPEELERLQVKKLKKIIKYSYSNIPFYRKLFKQNNIKPDYIKRIEDLSKIPIITKEDVILNNKQIISKKIKIYEVASTTGTTGKKLTVFYDNRFTDYYYAIRLRSFFDYGYKPLEHLVILTPSVKKTEKNLREIGTIFKMTHISSKLPVKNQIELIEKINPTGIVSSALSALNLATNNIELKTKLKFVTVGGEVLTKNTRKILQNYFNAEIFDIYGCQEALHTAWECKYGGFHLNSDYVITEFSNNDFSSDTTNGGIIITTLENFKMPFIRYSVGDILTLRNDYCSCGRKLPQIKEIQGRYKDFIVLKNFDLMSPRRFIEILENIFGNITEFKLIKERKRLKLFIKKDYSKNRIKKEIKSLIKDFPDFDIKTINEFKREIKVNPIVFKN